MVWICLSENADFNYLEYIYNKWYVTFLDLLPGEWGVFASTMGVIKLHPPNSMVCNSWQRYYNYWPEYVDGPWWSMVARRLNLWRPRTPEIDKVPVIFVKACKEYSAEPVTLVSNYITEYRSVRENWARSIRPVVFKSGRHNIKDSLQCITLLPIMKNNI